MLAKHSEADKRDLQAGANTNKDMLNHHATPHASCYWRWKKCKMNWNEINWIDRRRQIDFDWLEFITRDLPSANNRSRLWDCWLLTLEFSREIWFLFWLFLSIKRFSSGGKLPWQFHCSFSRNIYKIFKLRNAHRWQVARKLNETWSTWYQLSIEN